jgi:GxxExxY protein
VENQGKTPTLFAPVPDDVERVGKAVLDAAYKVHTTLGPGFLESVYEACLAYEIRESGIAVQTQVALPIVYEKLKMDSGLRLDLLAGNCVVVELKAVDVMHPVYQSQLLTYLKLSGFRLGFLINFNVTRLKSGISRMVV